MKMTKGASIKVGSLQQSVHGEIVRVTESINGGTFSGVVIYPTDKYEVGFHSKDWNARHFFPFSGELKLTTF